MPKWAKLLHLCIMVVLCSVAQAMVPPHPLYEGTPDNWQASIIELPKNLDSGAGIGYNSTSPEQLICPKTLQEGDLPQNILALMVEFSDVHFRNQPSHPDSLVHDAAFFERWMLHLSDFYLDASHSAYEMNYTVYPQVFQLPRPMSYYGGDTSEKTDANLPQMLQDIMPLCSNLINFGDYDGLIIFHAGAGQEADLSKKRKTTIWSTFLTRKLLQSYFDPENDEYPGFTTPDGAVLNNIVIVPEDEYHDYFPGPEDVNASSYIFSIYGVLAHQFGHVLGLPTLFDGDSSDGASQGIGNWGLMGTGVWNANGNVPAQLSAWCRYYLGWDEAIEISEATDNLLLDHFLNHDPGATRLYKILISDTEYFLIENRQQNPDGSMAPLDIEHLDTLWPSYSFKLLPEGEQTYYDEGHLMPKFDFSTNRYTGCEWDFFLPGYGLDPRKDGSGILIWHIDEAVIAEKFSPNFDINRVNGNAMHKGVDLEEADGYQNLDTSVISEYKYGGPFDSFRAGNNVYFGDSQHNGLISMPTSESYYGGIPLEIYDISENGNQMSFSVRFAWRIEAGYEGESLLPPAVIDFDGDGDEEILYPMPNGKIALFADDTMAAGFPVYRQNISQFYCWDGSELYVPMQQATYARLGRMNKDGILFPLSLKMHHWINHPVDTGERLYLPLYDDEAGLNKVLMYGKNSWDIQGEVISVAGELSSNCSWIDGKLYALHKSDQSENYDLLEWDENLEQLSVHPLALPADSLAFGLFAAPLKDNLNIIAQCPSSIYVFNVDDSGINLRNGFPVVFPDSVRALITIQDWDSNGCLDLIAGRSSRVYIYDHMGSDNSSLYFDMGAYADSIAAGALALDVDGDGNLELAAALSRNRLAVWEESSRLKSGYPQSFAKRGRHLPFVTKGADNQYYIWMAADNGSLFRNPLPDYRPETVDTTWICEYANLRRTASRGPSKAQNQYESDHTFVENELYIFPNPLKQIYGSSLKLSVMPTQDIEIELAIYDISGNLVFKQRALTYAYLRNLDAFNIPADKLSSGVYLAIIKGGGTTKRLRFGIEK
ncbi:MAG: M6 family metalloprotease domain-containing protein [Candidatus Cloacimonetes bacterium]|nr:M6 family metalloprotease domain-containing protein [Candidatus Cloacimonadota bacterium]MDD2506765.1 M6 family metalloprotease domain-containing protein [Candidatus Cloacimonadota bacterium]MDD4560259.1 M6 family metalloprotease domain-containing protein [Candidatus Cloacimonadota bacterium]